MKSDEKPKKEETSHEYRSAIEPEQRRRRNASRGGNQIADWGSADSVLVLSVIQSITARGYAVQFGYTKDGSTYSVRIVGDGQPFTEYVRPTEDIDLYLTSLYEDYKR